MTISFNFWNWPDWLQTLFPSSPGTALAASNDEEWWKVTWRGEWWGCSRLDAERWLKLHHPLTICFHFIWNDATLNIIVFWDTNLCWRTTDWIDCSSIPRSPRSFFLFLALVRCQQVQIRALDFHSLRLALCCNPNMLCEQNFHLVCWKNFGESIW